MNTVVLLTSTKLGNVLDQDLEFGTTMLANFLHALESQKDKVQTIVCYTEGVKSALKGTNTALSLQLLQDSGVRILLCGSCLKHYNISSEDVVGQVSNMAEISQTLLNADKVMRP